MVVRISSERFVMTCHVCPASRLITGCFFDVLRVLCQQMDEEEPQNQSHRSAPLPYSFLSYSFFPSTATRCTYVSPRCYSLHTINFILPTWLWSAQLPPRSYFTTIRQQLPITHTADHPNRQRWFRGGQKPLSILLPWSPLSPLRRLITTACF